MRLRFSTASLFAAVLVTVAPVNALSAATGGEPAAVVQVDAAPCLAAASSDDDDDKVDVLCAALIDNEKTPKPDLVKALIARGAHFARRGLIDRAIADDSRALSLDPSADVFNARGELWLRKGDRPKAVQDFGAALKLDPNHEKAKANHKAMARELERIGAQMAVAGKPSFPCAQARRAVEKAICANRELADLDREIFAANARVIREARSNAEARSLQRAQDDFIARRNADFGRPGYDLKKALQERLQRLNGIDGY